MLKAEQVLRKDSKIQTLLPEGRSSGEYLAAHEEVGLRGEVRDLIPLLPLDLIGEEELRKHEHVRGETQCRIFCVSCSASESVRPGPRPGTGRCQRLSKELLRLVSGGPEKELNRRRGGCHRQESGLYLSALDRGYEILAGGITCPPIDR